MPGFHRLFDPTVAPLFQLLSDPSLYRDAAAAAASAGSSSNASSITNNRAFSPNFDVHETESAFVLEGELPGLSDKKAVSIEFTDGNTLLVQGKIERSYQTSSEEPQQQKITEQGEHHESHKPTVEDAPDDDDVAAGNTTVAKASQEKERKELQRQQPRYWVSERSIGTFQRSFNFPGDIDHEKVTAKLKDGILTVVVPKKVHPAPRRVLIE